MRRFVSHVPGAFTPTYLFSVDEFRLTPIWIYRDAFCVAWWNPLKSVADRGGPSTANAVAEIASTLKSKLFHIENWNRSMKLLFK
jgi:hypothetical protein